jgi:putative N6-adenine-specific DNA methylase
MSNFQMTAQTLFGLEEVLARELEDLGAADVVIQNRAVSFVGDTQLLYKANLCLRTALRILVPMRRFEMNNEDELYAAVKKIAWEKHLTTQDSLAVSCSLYSPHFRNSQYLERKTKDAIVDRLREIFGSRPSVNLQNPTLHIHLYVHGREGVLSLDSSGDSLHKRGYRDHTNLAPINEVLAAGLVLLSGWDKKSNFIDPMCGSATLLIEAALLAKNIPAGSYRERFGFENWNTFDSQLWADTYDEAMDAIQDEAPAIVGGEISKNTARKAIKNVLEANLRNVIQIENVAFEDLMPPNDNASGTLILNPPYGERMDKDEDINQVYASIGDAFKKNWAGYQAWVITSNLEAAKHIHLKPSRRIKLYNASLECRFYNYQLYQGSKKTKKQNQE